MGVKCCSFYFKEFSNFDIHLKQTHFYKDQIRVRTNHLICKFQENSPNGQTDCNRQFNTLSGFKKHLRFNHANQVIYNAGNDEINQYEFKDNYHQFGVTYNVSAIENVS